MRSTALQSGPAAPERRTRPSLAGLHDKVNELDVRDTVQMQRFTTAQNATKRGEAMKN